jgi:hypothetical protein
MKIIFLVLGGLIIIILVAAGIDVAKTPTAPPGRCVLQRRLVLPDTCVGCASFPAICTATTRPYLFFLTQSATCVDAVICPGG